MSVSSLARRAYFAAFYNTTVSVNMLLTLGVVAPYILLQLANHGLSIGDALTAIGLTLLTTYCYIVVYISNDYLDRHDQVSQSPKRTALDVLGRRSLWLVPASVAAVLGLGILLWPNLAPFLVGYILILTALSIVHSRSRRTKAITVFLERLCKFVMPLVAIYTVIPHSGAEPYIVATLMLFPWSYMADYTYRGYLGDRLKKHSRTRFVIYAAYSLLLAIGFGVWHELPLIISHAPTIASYFGVYALLAVLATHLAKHLPWDRIDTVYNPKAAAEKRRLLTYGFVQIVAIGVMICYLLFKS